MGFIVNVNELYYKWWIKIGKNGIWFTNMKIYGKENSKFFKLVDSFI